MTKKTQESDNYTDYSYHPRLLMHEWAKENRTFGGAIISTITVFAISMVAMNAILIPLGDSTPATDNNQTSKTPETILNFEQGLKNLEAPYKEFLELDKTITNTELSSLSLKEREELLTDRKKKLRVFKYKAENLIDKTIHNADISEAQAQSIAQEFIDNFVPLEDIGKRFGIEDYGSIAECKQAAFNNISNISNDDIRYYTEGCLEYKATNREIHKESSIGLSFALSAILALSHHRMIDLWADEKPTRRRKKEKTNAL